MSVPMPRPRVPLGLEAGGGGPRLYDRIVQVMRTMHYSRRTQESYLYWIRKF
jgi:hypothetical protein